MIGLKAVNNSVHILKLVKCRGEIQAPQLYILRFNQMLVRSAIIYELEYGHGIDGPYFRLTGILGGCSFVTQPLFVL